MIRGFPVKRGVGVDAGGIKLIFSVPRVGTHRSRSTPPEEAKKSVFAAYRVF